MNELADQITDCARSHFAWDSPDSPETKTSMDAFKEKVVKILRAQRRRRQFKAARKRLARPRF
jgi:hypothetical protein